MDQGLGKVALGPVRLTIQQHMAAVRHQKDGMTNLVVALKEDGVLAQEAKDTLDQYAEMENGNHMGRCWISRFTRDTLKAALAKVHAEPDVPEGT